MASVQDMMTYGGGGGFLALLTLNPVPDVTETQPYVLVGFLHPPPPRPKKNLPEPLLWEAAGAP